MGVISGKPWSCRHRVIRPSLELEPFVEAGGGQKRRVSGLLATAVPESWPHLPVADVKGRTLKLRNNKRKKKNENE